MDNFQFQIVITEECNLGCDYCYMEKRPGLMDNRTLLAHFKMLPKIMEEYDTKTYTVGWFGGEPLLNWKLIEKWAPIFNKDPKCSSQFIATNGLALGPEREEFLRKYGVGISISFDGLWNKHNRTFKNGESSFEKYVELKNILQIRNCKVMVSPNRQAATLKENYEWFVEDFGVTSPDFTLVRDDIWTDQDVEDFKDELTELTDMNIWYIKEGVQSLVGWYGLYFLDTWLGKRYGKRQHGCFAGRYGLGFMPDGKAYPCARFGSNEKYPVWDSLSGKKIEFNYDMFMNPSIYNPSTYRDCKRCDLYQICNAGCTYSQLHYKDGEEYCSPIPNLCKLFHLVYSEMGRIVKEVGHTSTFKEIVYNLTRSIG